MSKLRRYLALICLTALIVPKLVNADPGDVTKLVIEDAPDTVEAFTDFSFKVIAQDNSDSTITDYDGTVVFTSETDENAKLPGEHTFDPEVDSGEKIFNESYFFTEEGEQELTVTDEENPELTTTITINVVEADLENDNTDEENGIKLTSPTEGTSNESTITVRGETTPGLTVEIFNDEELLGSADADIEGNFQFQTPVLPDGSYKIRAVSDELESKTVNVTIQTQAPEISFIELSPSTVNAGQNFNIQLTTANDARVVKVKINDILHTLKKDTVNSKLFKGTITAPTSAGNYPIKVNIEDDLGNVANNLNTNKTLVVNTTSVNGGDNEELTFQVPSQVLGLTATPSDKKITLNWQAATAANGIKNYAIYYGTAPTSLPLKVETKDAATTWYIPELTNGTTYYFQIYAIDNNNQRGDQGSAVISATPVITGQTTLLGSAPNQVQPNAVTNSGPGLLFLGAGSLFAAKIIRKRKA